MEIATLGHKLAVEDTLTLPTKSEGVPTTVRLLDWIGFGFQGIAG